MNRLRHAARRLILGRPEPGPGSGDLPYAVVLPTEYGLMIVNRNDINQAGALFRTGRAHDHEEVELLRSVLARLGGDLVVLDIGANFGTHTLGLADMVGEGGRIHAFEAQRLVFQMLAGSVALNGLEHVHVHHLALGDREGELEIPQYDHRRPLNFGSVEFGGDGIETLEQERGHDPSRLETVRMTTVDAFHRGPAHLMKIDVEGMEPAVLDGARETIGAHRPVLYVEYLKGDREALRRRIASLGYRVHDNAASFNYLAIPEELAPRMPVATVKDPASRHPRLAVPRA